MASIVSRNITAKETFQSSMHKHLNTNVRPAVISIRRRVKSFRDIPGPMTLPLMSTPLHVLPHIGTHHNLIGVTMMHKYRQKYGDIVRLGKNLRNRPAIFLFEPELFEQVFESDRVETPKFHDSPLEFFRQRVLKIANIDCSLSKSQKDAIFDRISCMDKATDIAENLYNQKLKETKINDDKLFYKYAVESLIRKTKSHNDCITADVYKTITECFDNCYSFKSPSTVDKESELFQNAIHCYESQHNVLKDFLEELGSPQVELDQRAAKLSDVLFSHADRIVHAAVATLYFLAINPAKQQILQDELSSGYERHYLRACLKETERLLPLTGGIVKRTTGELVLNGFHIPVGIDIILTHHLATLDSTHYSRPKHFIPERWLVDSNHAMYHGHAHRYACPIRESQNGVVVNQAVECLIEKLLEKFNLEWHGTAPLLITKSFNHFAGPHHFVLKPR